MKVDFTDICYKFIHPNFNFYFIFFFGLLVSQFTYVASNIDLKEGSTLPDQDEFDHNDVEKFDRVVIQNIPSQGLSSDVELDYIIMRSPIICSNLEDKAFFEFFMTLFKNEVKRLQQNEKGYLYFIQGEDQLEIFIQKALLPIRDQSMHRVDMHSGDYCPFTKVLALFKMLWGQYDVFQKRKQAYLKTQPAQETSQPHLPPKLNFKRVVRELLQTCLFNPIEKQKVINEADFYDYHAFLSRLKASLSIRYTYYGTKHFDKLKLKKQLETWLNSKSILPTPPGVNLEGVVPEKTPKITYPSEPYLLEQRYPFSFSPYTSPRAVLMIFTFMVTENEDRLKYRSMIYFLLALEKVTQQKRLLKHTLEENSIHLEYSRFSLGASIGLQVMAVGDQTIPFLKRTLKKDLKLLLEYNSNLIEYRPKILNLWEKNIQHLQQSFDDTPSKLTLKRPKKLWELIQQKSRLLKIKTLDDNEKIAFLQKFFKQSVLPTYEIHLKQKLND